MRFKFAGRLGAAFLLCIIAGLAAFVVWIKRHYEPNTVQIHGQNVADSGCSFSFNPQALGPGNVDWKKYINTEPCFAFFYPQDATFYTANPGTPYAFLVVSTAAWRMEVSSRSVEGSAEISSQLPTDWMKKFSGYSEIGGGQWVKLAEIGSKSNILNNYYVIREHYLYEITVDSDPGSALSTTDMILQTFQFSR